MNNLIILISILLFNSIHLNGQVQINVNSAIKSHTVSPMIQGFGLIYSFEANDIYEDGSMAQLFKDVGAGYLRYPGGAVTTMYHWNDLNGHGWTDNWNGTYERANDQDPQNYMDLDEYMALCEAADLEPMLGINMSSGRNYNRQEDGLNEAVSMLKYCNEKKYEVKYLYLDNENHHKKWPPEEYGNQIVYYVDSIKKYAPDAKLIGNWTDKFRSNKGSFRTLLNIAGDYIDYMDVHWYWKWENGSWAEWKAKTPMENETEWYPNGGTFVEEIEYFDNLMVELGKPHIKLASMEWNLGPGKYKDDPTHSRFKTALMQSEMQMQMMQGGLEIASLWSTHWPNDTESDFRFLVSSSNNYQPTPTAKFYELYKHALNGDLVQSSSTHSQVMCTSVIKDNKAFVYLLNKANQELYVNISLAGNEIQAVNQALTFKNPGVLESINVELNDNHYKLFAPENTLTMIEFQLKDTGTSGNEIHDKSEIKIYPNPASENVTIRTNKLKGKTKLELYNMLGLKVSSQAYSSMGNRSIIHSVEHLPNGAYFMVVSDETGNFNNSKLIVNN
jgi:alpha-L-arabinofuranosidase